VRLAETAVSAILQVLIFTAIPFVVYVITHRRVKGFFDYVGLRGPERRAMLVATLLAAAIALTVLLLATFAPGVRDLVAAPGTTIGSLRSLGFSGTAVAMLAIQALVQTSLSEEILFRGFVAKRLIGWLGFTWGNVLQGLVFGAVHLLIFTRQDFALLPAAGVLLFSGLGGWMLGYLNERIGDGSILPGWWLHGLGNTLAYGLLGFLG
jgi:membrane protease YdiL (CAAX protease family)